MGVNANALRWNREPGHYEVYYLTLTDPESGIGFWIRYTLLAPNEGLGEPSCSLWFMAFDPNAKNGLLARKLTFPATELNVTADPFRLELAGAVLTDAGASGSFEDVSWDLNWEPAPYAYDHVHPVLEKLKIAKTVFTLPHADVAMSGTLRFLGRELTVEGVHGGQCHVWGAKHALRWSWLHCGDFTTLDGTPRPGTFLNGVSGVVPRYGREIGPATPLTGRINGVDFNSIAPHRIFRNKSVFSATGWRFEAVDGKRRIIGHVDAARDKLIGVTYTDPDGERVYCYNSEVCDMQLEVYERAASRFDYPRWRHTETLVSKGRAHFEYAQRSEVPNLDLLVK